MSSYLLVARATRDSRERPFGTTSAKHRCRGDLASASGHNHADCRCLPDAGTDHCRGENSCISPASISGPNPLWFLESFMPKSSSPNTSMEPVAIELTDGAGKTIALT